jgi:uncharacterized protein involved in exopolysaccharide biosynthesis
MENMTEPGRAPGTRSIHDPSPPVAVGMQPEDDIGAFQVINMILERRRLLVWLPLTVGIIVAVVTLFIPPTYRATTSLVPEARQQSRLPTGMSALAGQLGFTLGVDATQTPRFYADVLKSRELLERLAVTRYDDPRSADPRDSTDLLPLLRIKGVDRSDSLYRAARKLFDLVTVRVDNQTSIMRISMDSRYPGLAAAIANHFVLYLNDFNAQNRKSQARERRKFTEERVNEAQGALTQAEQDLRDFHDRNRRWQESAALQFREASFRRQVAVAQEVYLTLRREFESARIDEVNETPVITVIDPATVPHQRVKPKRTLTVLVSVAIAFVVAVTVALFAGFARRTGGATPEEYERFRILVAETRRDLRRVLGLGPRVRAKSQH